MVGCSSITVSKHTADTSSTVPYRMIARSADWVFQAEAPYELSGLVPNVVFPTGLLARGDELWLYYGAADTYVCLATAKLADVLAVLRP